MKTMRDIILSGKHGDVFCHKTLKNRDGLAVRAKVNGKLRTWKRRPDYFKLPMKHGMYDCFYITPANIDEWTY